MVSFLRRNLTAMSLAVIASTVSSPVNARGKDLLIMPGIFELTNGWNITCYGLEKKETSCSATHRTSQPYLRVNAGAKTLTVAVSDDCHARGKAYPFSIERKKKPMWGIIGEVSDEVTRRTTECSDDPMHREFVGEMWDVLALLIRVTAF